MQENATLKGAMFVISCMFILGLGDNLVRFFSGDISVFQFHLMRSVLVCLVVLIAARLLGQTVRPKNIRNIAIRSVLYATAMLAYFASLDAIPVAHAAAALFTAPLFMVLLEAVFSNAGLGKRRILAVIIGFAGALVILRPFGDDVSIFVLLPLIGAVFYALGLMCTRSLCNDETTLSMVIGLFISLGLMGAIGTIWTSVILQTPAAESSFLTRSWVPISGTIAMWMVIQAGFATSAMTLQTRGYQLAPASLMSIFEYCFLIFAAVWGVILWQDDLGLFEYVGMAMIVVAGCIIALRKQNPQGT